jgi:hypothetical protein
MNSSKTPAASSKEETNLCSALAQHKWTVAADLMESIADAGKTVEPFTLKLLADYIRAENRPDRYKVKQGQGAKALTRIMAALEDRDRRANAQYGEKGNERSKIADKYGLADVRSLDHYWKETRDLLNRRTNTGGE